MKASAVERDLIGEFFDEYSGAVPELAHRLRGLIRAELPDAAQELDRSVRLVGYSFGPGYASLICTIIPSKTSVKLGLIGGAHMNDPAGLLEGASKQHHNIAFVRASDFDRPRGTDLLRAAATHWKQRHGEKA